MKLKTILIGSMLLATAGIYAAENNPLNGIVKLEVRTSNPNHLVLMEENTLLDAERTKVKDLKRENAEVRTLLSLKRKGGFPAGVCQSPEPQSDDLAGTIYDRQGQPGRDQAWKSGCHADIFRDEGYTTDRRDRESEVRNQPYFAGVHGHEPGFLSVGLFAGFQGVRPPDRNQKQLWHASYPEISATGYRSGRGADSLYQCFFRQQSPRTARRDRGRRKQVRAELPPQSVLSGNCGPAF